METIKTDANIQNVTSQTVDNYNKESVSTRSQIGQNALTQSKLSKQAKNIMSESISGMDIELEQIDNKIHLLEHDIGIRDSKFIEEMNRLDLNKISSKEEYDRIMKRIKKTWQSYKKNQPKCIKK